jgi:RNA polymerase sigma-70 factor (ECF subfamily)
MLTGKEGESDAALWVETLSGSDAAFSTLFDRHRTRVFRKAYARIQNVADCEDIVAMVFMEAWKSRKKVRIVEGSLLPWLLTTTTYVTLNFERSSRRYRKALGTLPDPGAEPDHSETVNARIDNERVTNALRKLGEAERKIVDLCVLEDLPLTTVATLLDLPVGTVKSRLSRARGKLRDALSAAGFTAGGISEAEAA